MAKESRKPHISVVVIGAVDSGKSTLIGQLAIGCGCVDARSLERLENERRESGFSDAVKYAWMLDKLKSERVVTSDGARRQASFETATRAVTLLDAPGPRDYCAKMIAGISQADCALLVVFAAAGEFEDGISRHGQTREHAALAQKLGVCQLIVACNKMDTTQPPYSEARFTEIKHELSAILQKIGYAPATIAFVPIAGYVGENLLEASPKMPWFEGWTIERDDGTTASGATLLEALDAIGPPRGSA